MRFFFYGTLIAGSDNPVATAAHALLRDLGPATTPGALFACDDPDGWYPVLLPGTGTVHGRLYAAAPAFAPADLAALDAYEGYDPAAPGAGLYRRETIAVTDAAGTPGRALAYVGHGPPPAGTRPIAAGDFAAWIAREALRPYGSPC